MKIDFTKDELMLISAIIAGTTDTFQSEDFKKLEAEDKEKAKKVKRDFSRVALKITMAAFAAFPEAFADGFSDDEVMDAEIL